MQGVNHAELQNISRLFLQGMKSLEVSPNWEKKQDKPLTVYEMKVDERIVAKGIKVLNLPFDMVLNFLSKPDVSKITNGDQIQKLQTLYDKQGLMVMYAMMKMPGPIANRQVVTVRTVKIEGDKAYLGNKSCNFPFKKDKDSVVAVVHTGGYIIEKIDENRTNLINISDVDVAGSIPEFIKNALASKGVESLENLEKTIRTYSS